MGQGGSLQSGIQSWEGKWQFQRCEGLGSDKFTSDTIVRIRIAEQRCTMEFHDNAEQQHLLLCGDISGTEADVWEEAPADAIHLANSFGAKSTAGSWRLVWVEEPTCLRMEFKGDQASATACVDWRITSDSEMKVSTMNDLTFVFQRLPSEAEGMDGPAPVSWLRDHGRPLDTAEERMAALDQVAKLITVHLDDISAVHERDRVFPARFDGTQKMMLGGIANYKALIPKFIEPEIIQDACPPPAKGGVEADWCIMNESKGVCINVAPWNAPVTLCLIPALAMLASGNRVVIKPPELVPNISALLRRLCQKYLQGLVWVEEGGKEAVNRLIDEGADHLVFTGGGPVGKIVAARCAKMLTPVTLELGGKSPVFIDKGLSSEMMDSAVREILETKVYKTGQFCCAHDYALVHDEAWDTFLSLLRKKLEEVGAKRNVAMIGRRQYEETKKKLECAGVECVPPLEGEFTPNDEAMTIPMTGLVNPSFESLVLTDEIFGPLLPICRVGSVSEAIGIINRKVTAKPLIAYCYTQDSKSSDCFAQRVSAGNIAVNSGPARMLANYNAGFGGVGPSGSGTHFWGLEGLREFTNRKSVIRARGGFAKSYFSGPPAPPS
eukprot:TRINITY_DN25324_c0_g1_i1.p1 TRINITY_DN25324_c0_g1~~TRINITY_DN25324_c0_g1_i1.p1  ORF type:complete len:608 (+),score=94.35 TRINITY_DN25324_c0_g1_i1:97-1920(+)